MKIKASTLSYEEKTALSLRGVYEQYGYKRYKMSKFEEYALYADNKNFLQSENVIAFNDLDGKLLALKPDVTLSIAKSAKAYGSTEKLYYTENVYRLDKNAKKYKEIAQMGLEAIGEIDGYVGFETVLLALLSLNEIDENFVLDISDVGLLTGVLDVLPEIDGVTRSKVTECIKTKNEHDLRNILKTVGVSVDKIEMLSKFISIGGDLKTALSEAKCFAVGDTAQSALKRLEELCDALDGTGYIEKIRLDFSIINDTAYYNGLVFMGYVPKVPRAVLSGGRYDRLLNKLGKKRCAIGFALYLDEINQYYNAATEYDVDCLLLYGNRVKNSDERVNITDIYKAVNALRQEGNSVRAESSMPDDIKCKVVYEFNDDGSFAEVENV